MLGPAAESLRQFTAELIVEGLTWWLEEESISLTGLSYLGDADDPGPLYVICLGIGVVIATLLAIAQGLRMIITRKGAPLLQLVKGLFLHAVVVAVGVAVIDSLLTASDAVTEAIVDTAFVSAEEAPEQVTAVLLPQISNPIGLLAVAAIVLLLGLLQLVALFLKQSALPIIALVLPIASSGQVGEGASRQWLPKLVTLLFGIILYKPMAALIIALGFAQLTEEGDGWAGWVRGLVTLTLSILALPTLLAVFSNFGVQVGSSVASAGGLAPAVMSAVSMAGSRGGGAPVGGGPVTAVDHAERMGRDGPAASAPAAGGPASPPGRDGGPGRDGSGRDGAAAVQQANQPHQENGPRSGQENGATVPGQQTGDASTPAAPQPPGGQPGAPASAGPAPAPAAAGGGVRVAMIGAEAAKSAVDSAARDASGAGNDGNGGGADRGR
ncbi:hypothetical protein [Streptomyces zhaozhouensis]|uniref:hypothetical protein n=1 Tax=Streptomyces zhaozhouensis TaxID=1300267 RepID=UPI000BE40CF2|nr:hypothetical protein [Streptomyces zhaozhouensis]